MCCTVFVLQEPVSKVENEASEEMGRVDEGVEEFFTKKIIPDYALWVEPRHTNTHFLCDRYPHLHGENEN